MSSNVEPGQALGHVADGADHGVALASLLSKSVIAAKSNSQISRAASNVVAQTSLGGERAVEARQRREEALVLVLGALDGGEHALGLDGAQHLLAARLHEELFVAR